MSKKFKILIGYDGSECAAAALDDLRRAGLPAAADVLLISVADVFLPPPVNEEADDTVPNEVSDSIRQANERAAKAVDNAREFAGQACERVKKMFPKWNLRFEAFADSPAWAVIRISDEWKPDLVVVGAQGHAYLGGRLILGSVSQRVLYESRCSVRIARAPRERSDASDSALRILIGTDGSPDAELAIDSVASREWPNRSEARVISVLDKVMPVTPDPSQPTLQTWVQSGDEEQWTKMSEAFEPSAEKLRKAGLNASVMLRKGSPKNVLVEAADEWGADSIFLGAKGLRGIDRLLLGSVSAAVAARASCSVEIARRPSSI